MARHKTSRFNKTLSGKKPLQTQRQSTTHYQSLTLWMSFLWSLITLGLWSQRMGVEAQPLPATIDLANLKANQGLVIQGAAAGDYLGQSVSHAGDVNDDGITDLVFGVPNASPGGRTHAGAAYVIYGSRNLPTTLDLNTLNVTQGMIIQGSVGNGQAGASVCVAGDINHDGITDLVLGDYLANRLGRSLAGEAYVIYGSHNLPAILDLKALTSTQGMLIQGAEKYDYAGWAVSAAGDVNGDDISDLLVGARRASPLARETAGVAYVIYGGRSLPGPLDLKTLTSSQGMLIQGALVDDYTGYSVSAAGDVNGDGIADFAIGAPDASRLSRNSAGVVYVIYGSRNLPVVLDLKTLNVTQGMVIQGAVAKAQLGYWIRNAGDINDDGIADLVLGAKGAGAVYVIYGSRSLPAILDLEKKLTTTQGMVVEGSAGRLGVSVSGAGDDLNSDGIVDLALGAWGAGVNGAGIVYVIYGSRNLPAVLDLNQTLSATQGMIILGVETNDNTGSPPSIAGDVNGDGISDLVIRVSGADPLNRTGAGAVYVIYGKPINTSFSSSIFTSATSLLPTATNSSETEATTLSIPGPIPQSSTATPTSRTDNPINTGDSISAIPIDTTDTSFQTTLMQNKNPETQESNTISPVAVGGAVVGIALTACLGAIGFYAYRKKSRVTQANNSTLNTAETSLNKIDSYQQLPITPSHANSSHQYLNMVLPLSSNGEKTPSPSSQYGNAPAAPQSSHYNNNIPPVQTDPYAGVQFANLGELNREMDEQTAKEQQALHQTCDDVTVLAPKK